MSFLLPPSIFFNLAKEKPIIIKDGLLYTLGGNRNENFLFLFGEKINISESDSLSFFEEDYKQKNDSKINDVLSKVLKEKYNVKTESYEKDLEVIDFIVNKVFYEYDHYYSDVEVNIDFSNINDEHIRRNYRVDINIDFSNSGKSIFESIVNNVFLDYNSVFSLDEISNNGNFNGSDNYLFLNDKHYLIQPTPFILDSLEEKYQKILLERLEKRELRNNDVLSKRLESVEKQKKLKDISSNLKTRGFYEKNKKGIYKKSSKFLPYVTTDDEFVLQNKATDKYFLLSKFRIAVDIKKSNRTYVVNGEPFVLEEKFHPFVYYDSDYTSWKYKKSDLGFHICCYDGRFNIDSRLTPEKKIACALKSGIGLIERGYMPNVNPVHDLVSDKFKEINEYEMQRRGLKVQNSG
jgi:hypothetical protein